MERVKNWVHEMERAKNWLPESWSEYIDEGVRRIEVLISPCENANSEKRINDILTGFSSATVLAEKMANKGSAYHFCKHISEIFADCNKHKDFSSHEYSHLLSKCGRYVSQRRTGGDHTEDKHEALERIASMKGGDSGAEEMAIPYGLIFMAYTGCESNVSSVYYYGSEKKKHLEKCKKKYAGMLEKILV